MNDAFVVGGGEGVRRFVPRWRALRDGQRAAAQTVGQRGSVNQFEYEPRRPVDSFEVVNRPNVRMIECRKRAGLALEARDALGIRR